MRVYAGPQRSFEDFQNRSKKYAGIRKKSLNDDDMIYLADIGYLTPPEINFFFNPCLDMERNLKEYEENKFKVHPDSMFRGCTSFEKWMFENSTKTHQTRRIRPELLFESPSTSRFDLSFLNTYITSNDDYADIELDIKTYWKESLYNNPDLKDLLELSRTLFYKKIPELIDAIVRAPGEIIDIYKLKRLMKKYGVCDRHLGIIAKSIQIPHIRDICVEKMIASSVNKVISFGFVDRHFDSISMQVRIAEKLPSENHSPMIKENLRKKESSKTELVGSKKAAKDAKDRRTSYKTEEVQRTYLLEFLRSLFSRTESSIQVWDMM